MAAIGLRRDDRSSDESSDDEGTPLNDIYGGNQRTSQETKKWDVFRDLPVKQYSGSQASQKFLNFLVKLSKVLAYIVTFCVVLFGSVMAKSALLFMTSQLKENKTVIYCNRLIGRDRQFIATLPEEERFHWIWCLFFAFAIPEIGSFIRSTRICFFKTSKTPTLAQFILVLVMETLSTIGQALLLFVILPEIDVIKGAMLTNCFCFIPGILGMLSRNKKDSNYILKILLDFAAITAQITGFIVWPLLESKARLWLIPVSAVLISIGWWENYVEEESSLGFIKTFAKIKTELTKSRYYIYRFVSLWKIGVFLGCMVLNHWVAGNAVGSLFLYFGEGWEPHNIIIEEIQPVMGDSSLPDFANIQTTGNIIRFEAAINTPLQILLLQVLGAYLAFIFGKFACKILIQPFSYAFPIAVTMPVCVNFLIAVCGLRNSNPCAFHGIIPDYLFFESPPVYHLADFIARQMAWVWLLWLLSQTWICIHIWKPKVARLASTEKLFTRVMYDGVLIDQSLNMNRRRDKEATVEVKALGDMERDNGNEYYERISVDTNGSFKSQNAIRSSDNITRIYVCGTMWHETKDEMMEFLKSIFRMDEDQCARRVAQKYLRVVDPDYYELETHIFMDDAFEITDHSDDDTQVNRFVKLLIDTIDEAASEVHQTNIRIRPPHKYPTPYGGRLVWTLPGKTKMFCHLKDKAKIRHRKRWSQVMYMYYLLGHRLMEHPISVNRKDVIAENTYLLALDGDIDFQPHAVTLLVDLMKKNKNLGAVCGRIHPIGSGPMVWYQMFEYAIGHWLQKATEHVIGCVLCSPGCFSLFRGKALMDDNVMRKYTTRSDQARHYVQYDQGEDRWLCTLLLQRGYGVDYAAASDAYTHCPEGFNEFYNQRRRWVPSTMANIFDLLMDYKRIIKINDNISGLYISYQMMMMGGSIFGPGNIFLMLVGAFVAAFNIDNWTAFYVNIIPIVVFVIVCFTCKADIQLSLAMVLSIGYGLVMVAVLIGMLNQIEEDGLLAPSTLFLALLFGSFFVAALVHPQEFNCLLYLFIYYITIPSMYLLLIIYALTNLNNVTWGTREVAKKKGKQELLEEKKELEEAKKKVKQGHMLSFLQSKDKDKKEGSFEFSLAGLCTCMLCTHPKGNVEQVQLVHIADTLQKLQKKIESVERALDPNIIPGRRRTSVGGIRDHHLGAVIEDPEEDQQLYSDDETLSTVPKEERDDLINPYWIEDPDLRKGDVDFLKTPEIQFWKDLIDKYLHPIEDNKEEQDRITKELKDLRDLSAFGFFMLNALFVLVVFLMQLNRDRMHIKWPLEVKTNVTYQDNNQEVLIESEYLELEPIGVVFIVFFAVVLIVQFAGMLFHRFGTFSHILSSTELNWYCSKKADGYSHDDVLKKNAVAFVKNLQKLNESEEENDKTDNAEIEQIGRRTTIHNLEKAQARRKTNGSLVTAFRKRYSNLKDNKGPGMPPLNKVGRETLKALEIRKKSLIAKRQLSLKPSFASSNEYKLSRSNQTESNAGITFADSESTIGGNINHAYEPALSDDDTISTINSSRPGSNQVRFHGRYHL